MIEGFHALKHALRFGAEILDARAAEPASLERLAMELAPDLVGRLEPLARQTPEDLFRRLSPSPHATGVIALARRPEVDVESILEPADPRTIVLLERPTHHGNLGAVVRVAAAADAAGVLVTGDHDPWHPASVRGGAGLQFALGVSAIEALPDTARPLLALDPAGEPLERASIPRSAVLVFGSERAGITTSLLERCDRRVAIPMRPGVSSMNLATAVAVALYRGAA